MERSFNMYTKGLFRKAPGSAALMKFIDCILDSRVIYAHLNLLARKHASGILNSAFLLTYLAFNIRCARL